MAQCHAERRKHPSAMDFYVGALHSKPHSSSTHWPSYNKVSPVNAAFTQTSQSFREEPVVESKAAACGGSFRGTTLAVNPTPDQKSSGNLSCNAAFEKSFHRKNVDAKLSQGLNSIRESNSSISKSLCHQSKGTPIAKETDLPSTKVSNVMNLHGGSKDPLVGASRGTTSKPTSKEVKYLYSDSSLNSVPTISTQGSEKSGGECDGKVGLVTKPSCNGQLNCLPRVYKSAELGVTFANKGALRAGNLDAVNRLSKSGEQIALKGKANAGNLKECLNGGLVVGGQRAATLTSADPPLSVGLTQSTAKEGGRWSSGGSNASADSPFSTGKDGARKASSSNHGSSEGGSLLETDMHKRSPSGGCSTAGSCISGGGNPTSKDSGRWVSTGNGQNSKDVPMSTSVRGMGNILAAYAKPLNSKGGCNDSKIVEYPVKKNEDLTLSKGNANGRGLLTANVNGDGALNKNLGNLCTGNWSNSAVNCNLSIPAVSSKAHNKPVDETKHGSGRMDPEDLKLAGNEQYRLGNYSEAVALYEKSIAICPTHAPYRSNRAAALTGLGKLGEAVQECEEAIKLDPGYSRAHQRAGHLYLRLGLIESAKRHLQAAGPLNDLKEAESLQVVQRHISKCIEARKAGDWRSALRESNAAVAAGADSAPQVLGYKSEALLKLRRLQEADVVCAAAQRHESSLHKLGVIPADPFLHMLRAHIELSLGRFKGAIGAAEAAMKIESRNLDAVGLVKKAKAVDQARTVGNELFKAGRFFEACAVYGEGLESDPNNAVLLSNRAACRSKLGQWEKALEDCDAALVAQPHYGKALMRRAHCNTKLERWEDALRDYEALRVDMPTDMEVARGHFDAEVALKKSRGEEIHRMKFGGEVEEVVTEDQFKDVVYFPGLSVVQFITRWNDRCGQMVPFINQLRKQFPCVYFVKVDVEENPCLAKSECVTFIPTFKVYKGGQKVKELMGPSEGALEHAIKHYSL